MVSVHRGEQNEQIRERIVNERLLSIRQFDAYDALYWRGALTSAQIDHWAGGKVSKRLSGLVKLGVAEIVPGRYMCPVRGKMVKRWRLIPGVLPKKAEKEIVANQPPLHEINEFNRKMSEAASRITDGTPPAQRATERISGYMSRCIDNSKEEQATFNMGYVQQIIEEECGK